MASAPAKGSDAEALHRYWVLGPGLAKWAKSPHPWTALHQHLSRYLTGDKLDRTTSAWHFEVFHQHPGSDAYRVEHGGKMRGKKIGPG
jgi:hypothetical protein